MEQERALSGCGPAGRGQEVKQRPGREQFAGFLQPELVGDVRVEDALVLALVEVRQGFVAAFGPRLGKDHVVVLQQEAGGAFPPVVLHLGIQRAPVIRHRASCSAAREAKSRDNMNQMN
jgi:hypothetical protein